MFICSMTVHSSSNVLSKRLYKNFSLIQFKEFQKESMFKIFNTILTSKLKEGFADTIVTKGTKLTGLILDIYEKSKLSFLPLPSKIHYMFNL